jgi:hypothetical protein
MTTKPIVTARYEEEAITERTHDGSASFTTPCVVLVVGFQLHDHENALRALDRATDNIRAQIRETK